MDIDLGSLWGLATVIGPIILGLALLWAMLRNRGSRREIEHTEEATRRMYEEQGRIDQARDAR